MWCDKCKSGSIPMMGGCYNLQQGQPCQANEVQTLKNCAECRKFSGTNGEVEFRCTKCKANFFQHKEGEGECHATAETHCTKDASVGQWMGFEKVSG